MKNKISKINLFPPSIIIILIALYLIFPEVFFLISKKVFLPSYTISANVSDIDIEERDGLTPFFVISKPPFLKYDTLLLSKPSLIARGGEILGREEELKLYGENQEGVTVGYIGEVLNKENILFILLTSSLAKEEYSIEGIVFEGSGLGGGGILGTLLFDIEVEVGDRVLHQETNSVVGSVSYIVEKESEGIKDIYISPSFNINEINYLYLPDLL